MADRAPVDVALRFLAQRPRSEHEVRARLRRAGVDEAGCEAVLGQLKRHGLLDDAQFATYWVEQRQTFRPRGARLLRAELRQRGIGAADADAAAAQLEHSAEEDAYRAAARRAQQLLAGGASVDERIFTSRIGQFLARRGFDWDTIGPVVARLWRERASGLAQTDQ